MPAINRIINSLSPSNKMPETCILTDGLIQFPTLRYPGQNRVRTVAITSVISANHMEDSADQKISELPVSADDRLAPHLQPPSVDFFRKLFTNLLDIYDEILAIFSSSALTPTYKNAVEAAVKVDRQMRIQVIDSQTFALGLGYLVKFAAEQLEKGISPKIVTQNIHSKIPHIFTLINIPSLSYLYYNGLIDRAQAWVGEKLELMPNFTLEEGEFLSTDKMRNKRHVTEYFLEYIKEFEAIDYIAYLYGDPSYSQTAKIIRDFLKDNYDGVEFTEHKLLLPTAVLFGPTCQGLIIVDDES